MGSLPTSEQRQRERAVLAAFAYDLCLIIPYAVNAFQVDSITMIGEILRGVLLISVAIVSWFTVRSIHRERTGAYDFGLGKHEQILSFMVALLLLGTVVVVAWKAATKVPEASHGVGVLNGLAVLLVFLNLLANAAPILPLLRSLRTGPSVIVKTQLRAKIAKTVGSVIVVASVAVDQLGTNPVVSVWADRVGSVIVILVTLHAAYELIRSALPDLLDRTLAEPLQLRINRVLAERFDDFDSIEWCRSRQSGSNIVIDIGLGFPAERAFGEVAASARGIVERIETAIPGSEATVTPVLAGRPG
jgi:divalent metal cation (Fe/Co/Zn/Cd) transporter